MKNIVIIVCDALSALQLPLYGYEKNTAPFLSSFGEENAFFPCAYANAPWTLPSHASLFSGELPHEHGTSTDSPLFTADSIVEDVSAAGYTTVGVSAHAGLEDAGFGRGFDRFVGGRRVRTACRDLPALDYVNRKIDDDAYDTPAEMYLDAIRASVRESDIRSLAHVLSDRVEKRLVSSPDQALTLPEMPPAREVNRLVKQQLSPDDQPFFLFVNYMDTHFPYLPPQEHADFTGRRKVLSWLATHIGSSGYGQKMMAHSPRNDVRRGLRLLYDGAITYLDAHLEDLITYIQETFEDTMIIITADHGENIGHHGNLYGHNFGIFERLIRVPLIISSDQPQRYDNRHVSLHELPDLIRGDIEKDRLGSGTVIAEYQGYEPLLERHGPPDEGIRPLIENTSTCIMKEDEGVTLHSVLDNETFAPTAEGFVAEEDVDVQRLLDELVAETGNDIAGIEI